MGFTWSKDLETGNVTIDGEHKELIIALNNLMTACSQGAGRAEVERTMDFLANYTAKHFSHEEQLQLQYGYPDFANHKKYHETFKATVAELSQQLKQEGATVALVGKVNTSVGGWLLNHIKREDVKVAAHIKSKS